MVRYGHTNTRYNYRVLNTNYRDNLLKIHLNKGYNNEKTINKRIK